MLRAGKMTWRGVIIITTSRDPTVKKAALGTITTVGIVYQVFCIRTIICTFYP